MTALKLGGLVLKEEQKAALYAVTLKKQDCLCILPTAFGKSPILFYYYIYLFYFIYKKLYLLILFYFIYARDCSLAECGPEVKWNA